MTNHRERLRPAVRATLDTDMLAIVAAIVATWRETLEGIFKTGDLLLQAKAIVPEGQWLSFVREYLPFKGATARRLMAIASDGRLRQESHATHLPICWYTLWELTDLSDEQFERGLQAGTINPSMLRADVELLKGSWVPGRGGSPKLAGRAASKGLRKFGYKMRPPQPDPVISARVAYFEATVELSPDENERELAACYAHFRRVAEDDDNEDRWPDDSSG